MHRFLAAIAAVLLAITACSHDSARNNPPDPAAVQPPSPPSLLLISLDGFHPDYLDPDRSPNLTGLAERGVRAQWLTPSFPSKTFPNHYTIVTGLVPDRHGIVDNVMLDDELGRFTLGNRNAVGDGRWWGGEPIWVRAHRHGLRTATMFWPGSEAEIQGIRPDHWFDFDASMPPAERVDQVLSWLDGDDDERIHFVSLYFEHVDAAAHTHGPHAPQVNAAIAVVDDAIGQLLAGLRERDLEQRVNLVVVSDHGLAEVPPEQVLLLEDIIDPALVEIVTLSEITGFRPRSGHEDEARRILLGAHQGMDCHDRERLPERWRYGRHARVPEIVCLLHEGWRISRREPFRPDWQAAFTTPRGAHGYDPELPSMRAIFITQGPSLRQGLSLGPIDNVHVYPLLARLLAIEPAEGDGDPAVTAAMLRQSSSAGGDSVGEGH